MGTRGRTWCFTLNNPNRTPEEVFASLDTDGKLRYAIMQRERGAAGTEHYQGYCEFTAPLRFARVQTLIFGAHIEPRRGTRDQARDYCRKEESRVAGPWEFGEFGEERPGARTDLVALRESVKSGEVKDRRDLMERYPGEFARYPKFCSALFDVYLPARDIPPEVHLLYGPTGCGKTRLVRETTPPDSTWWSGIGGSQWFDSYDSQTDAVFDDFAGKMSGYALTDLLRLLDRYPLRVPIKGGFVNWLPRRIWITTNIHPREWYDYTSREEHYDALCRRFTYVSCWGVEPDAFVRFRVGGEDVHSELTRRFFREYVPLVTADPVEGPAPRGQVFARAVAPPLAERRGRVYQFVFH